VSTIPAVGPCVDEGEIRQLELLLQDTFVIPAERSRTYFEAAGIANLRAIRRDTRLAGGLVLLPMGQWFGGRSVPMTGLAAVMVAPEFRARGVATELLHSVLAEMHAAGTALSTLYPATVALYRRVGYECAGIACDVGVPLRSIDLRDRTLDLRPARPEDDADIQAVYAHWAGRTAGQLDRSPVIWLRARQPRGATTQAFVVSHAGKIDGYLFVLTETTAPRRYDLRVSDWAARTPAAARRLLTYLADERTVRVRATWRSSPADPMLLHLAEAAYEFTGSHPWMVRIVHVVNALAARGYPPGVRTELHLHVHDDLLPGNDGRCVLHVADGQGSVTRGGRGTFDLHVRGLAALYTGFLSPPDLVLAQLAAAPEAELAAAAAVFGGPLPWMRHEY